jgi:putative CocE/NonD family hydrolase
MISRAHAAFFALLTLINPVAAEEQKFAPLPGPYQVGTADFFWVDEDRPETATLDPDDYRHLLVKVWYPAAPAKGAELAPYLPDLKEFEPPAKELFGIAEGLKSRSFADAPVVQSDERFPVLIYNHGGSWSRFTSSFVTEAMASYGYVVFSIDHTGFNKSTVFPDGYIYRNDAFPPPAQDAGKTVAENAAAFFEWLEQGPFVQWVGDVIFTLDQIELLNESDSGRFAQRLDLQRIGSFGWSFGGATSVQLASIEPRIRAVVNHDGQLFGDVHVKGVTVPFMLLHNTENPNPDNDASLAALVEEVEAKNESLLAKSSSDWYKISVKGSTHGSYSDLVLFYPAAEDGPGYEGFARQHEVIIDLTRDFFDKYLRGLGGTPLLRGVLQNYPELEMRSKTLEKHMVDQRVPMRDGIELSTDIYLPEGKGPFPTVLVRTPYGKSAETFARYKLGAYLQHGYAVAFQDTRGQGLSGGEFNFYFPEGKDGYDTIEWIAAQPWSDGKVAMDGGSYLGTVQWLAALEKPPHLKCIMPHAPSGRLFDELPYVGGAFMMEWALPWISERYPGTTHPENQDAMKKVLAHRPLLTMDVAYSGRELPLYRDMLLHPTLDEYWHDIHFTPEEFAQLDIPALTVTGWFDGDQSGALFYWSGMRANSPAADQQYLVVGPWEHAETYLNGKLSVGEMEFSALSALDVQVLRLGFLDWCLKGEERAFRMPRATVYLTGANRWLELEDYPSPASRTMSLYLSSNGKANTAEGDGKLVRRAPAQDRPDRYVFDPKNPLPSGPEAGDQRELEARDDVLVYTGPVLKDPVTVLGSPILELHASSDALDTDFTAKLVDVHPDGRAIKVNWSMGVLRARYRNGYEKEELLTPGQPGLFRIELSAIGHVFQPGHRIRLEVSSSNFPYVNPNQNTGNPVATDTEWRKANQAVHHSRKLPSRLQLPVIPNLE